MTIVEPTRTENRFVIYTNWSGYLKFLDAVGDRPIRVTYDRGKLELMSPTKEHEKVKTILGSLAEAMMQARGIDYEPGGSVTFKREDLDRGLEPDECYWVASYLAVKDREEYDAAIDPPPDLVIEVEVSRSMMNRLGIFRAVQVPEIWRWTERGRLEFHHRQDDGSYSIEPRSKAFPWLSSEDVGRFVRKARVDGVSATAEAFRAWVIEK